MQFRYDQFGYTLFLSKEDTTAWSIRPNNRWPCSTLAGHTVSVSVAPYGLEDFTLDGKAGDCDIHELEAIVSDHLPPICRHLWPTFEKETRP